METKVAEIAPKIYRLSTFVPDIAPPAGFTFNQFLVDADEPLLFHTGPRAMFPSVFGAVGKIIEVERLRWISFSHLEADESGAMNLWLAAAPKAQVTHGELACMVSLNDLADRPPRPLKDGEVIDIGGKKLHHIDTPHVPHGWDAGLFYDETSKTLLCSDLFSHAGNTKPITGESLLDPAIASENAFLATALTPLTAPTIRKLAALKPKTLAVMHGASFEGDCAGALNALADFYAQRLADSL
ncbi:MAG TPA: MBL fold metallo-hydrolase [Alphaproteobacteria bacterium]|nr:MBL fold metallo-hydrolase [Alphaproteobacteria bacterium]